MSETKRLDAMPKQVELAIEKDVRNALQGVSTAGARADPGEASANLEPGHAAHAGRKKINARQQSLQPGDILRFTHEP